MSTPPNQMIDFVDVYEGIDGTTILIRIASVEVLNAFLAGLSGLANGTLNRYDLISTFGHIAGNTERAVFEISETKHGIIFENEKNFVLSERSAFWIDMMETVELINFGAHQYFEADDLTSKKTICIEISVMER